MIDLHTHSSASDGSLSPEDLVLKAVSEGLSALALTDHDTTGGLDRAASVAATIPGFRFIPGIELEVAFEPGEFHLLGLDLRTAGSGMHELTGRLSCAREDRNLTIVDMLKTDGVTLDYDELRRKAGTGMIGRPHLAAAMVEARVVRTKQAAFDRYLGKGRPYYVPKACVTLEEAVAAVHEAGGLAFVAHPMSLFASWKRLRVLLDEWKEQGIDGIEAWHPTARVADCRRLEALAVEHGFRVSAGSDYHGAPRPDRRLGRTAGDKPIDDAWLAALER